MNDSTTSFYGWVSTQSIQLGFDIATSLSIIFAALTVMISSLLRNRAERKRGINERVISTAHSRVLDITTEFEDFFSRLVQSSQKIEKNIDARIDYDEDEDEDERYSELRKELIKNGSSLLDETIENVKAYRASIGDYYETIQKRRYTLIPLLDSIPNEEKFVPILEKDMDAIATHFNGLGRGDISLIEELIIAQEYVDSIIDEQSSLSDDERLDFLFNDEKMGQIFISIFMDPDYLDFSMLFIHEDGEDDFAKLVTERKTEGFDQKYLKSAKANFIMGLIKRPMMYVAMLLGRISGRVQRCRIECKDILIKLAAINHRLLVKRSNVRLEMIIEKYESDGYFGRKSRIR